MAYEFCPKKRQFRWMDEAWTTDHSKCQGSHYVIQSNSVHDHDSSHCGR